MRSQTKRRSYVAGLLALAATACSTGPERLNIGGNWQGTTTLSSSHATTLTLIQGGSTVSGTINIDSQLSGSFVGALNEGTRVLTWTKLDGCEAWSGSLTADSDANQMSGPVTVDRSACVPAEADGSGTMTLTRS